MAAVPVASSEALRHMRDETDEVMCALEPRIFQSVGQWYREFEQSDDSEVAALIAQSRAKPHRLVLEH